tara:strand:- start:60 stop:194 length:135 start_codon:yes stop_codon:yes gene_type:complete
MTGVITTLVIIALLAGWYLMPMMLRDTVVWSYDTVTKAIAYFKK